MKVYDGLELTDSQYDVSGLPFGFTVTATVEGSQKDVGTSENVVSDYAIRLGEFNVTAWFTNVKTEKGTLTVTPMPLTVTTPSQRKIYDGTPLTAADGVSLTGLVNGENAECIATGMLLNAGTTENTYRIEWGDGVKPDNYEIHENLGTLTVRSIVLGIETSDRQGKLSFPNGNSELGLAQLYDGILYGDIVDIKVVLDQEDNERLPELAVSDTSAPDRAKVTVSLPSGDQEIIWIYHAYLSSAGRIPNMPLRITGDDGEITDNYCISIEDSEIGELILIESDG